MDSSVIMVVVDADGGDGGVTELRDMNDVIVQLKTWPMFTGASDDVVAYAAWILTGQTKQWVAHASSDADWKQVKFLLEQILGEKFDDLRAWITPPDVYSFDRSYPDSHSWYPEAQPTTGIRIDDRRALIRVQGRGTAFAVVPSQAAEAPRWQVLSLDVWGNEEDGFEVNNTYPAGWIEIPTDIEDDEIVQLLIAEGHLNPEAVGRVEIDSPGDGDFLEVNAKETGEPLFQLWKGGR